MSDPLHSGFIRADELVKDQLEHEFYKRRNSFPHIEEAAKRAYDAWDNIKARNKWVDQLEKEYEALRDREEALQHIIVDLRGELAEVKLHPIRTWWKNSRLKQGLIKIFFKEIK